MNYNNDESEMWDWQGQGCGIEDNSFSIDIAECLGNEDALPSMLGDTTTPAKACGEMGYDASSDDALDKEFDQYPETLSQSKRRRMLQFEPEDAAPPIFNDEILLRSTETQDSLEDAISEMSQWVAGFSEDTSASTNDYLDPSADHWIADCLNDADMPIGTDNIGASDVQVDITGLCNTSNDVENKPTQTPQSIVFKGKKSFIRSPPKLASSVISPFTFIKPCGVLGDMTLKDINQRLHTPPKSNQDQLETFTTSAFSGKPVVGKTKIRTEGGEGSITIVRTKG